MTIHIAVPVPPQTEFDVGWITRTPVSRSRSTYRAALSDEEKVMWNQPGSMISRDHIERLLPIMRLTEEQRNRLMALPYPAPFEVVAELLGTMGITADELTDRAGGSP